MPVFTASGIVARELGGGFTVCIATSSSTLFSIANSLARSALSLKQQST